MILKGGYAKIGNLWFPPDIRSVNTAYSGSLGERLDLLEQETEKAILEGKVVVVNCKYLGVREEETRIVERAGVVSLRWGSPRLLLVTPSQSKALEANEELCRIWRLWRYQFDPRYDAWVDGSPAKAEALIRRNLEEGRDWSDGLLTEGSKP